MPDHSQYATVRTVILLIAGLLVMASGAAHAGFRDFFGTPKVRSPYAEVFLEEGRAYLALKEDAFTFDKVQTEVLTVGRPQEDNLGAGEQLVEIRGYFDSGVTATVAFDDGSGFSYAEGEPLTIRVYCAGLFLLSGEGEVVRHHYKTLALRNMNNPANLEEEFTLVRDLAERDAFDAKDRRALMFPEEAAREGKDEDETPPEAPAGGADEG